ncbi:uncharacterized protein FFUJ_10807 [Fusarium fujikuroi IMI 58289]|uniref:TauD/TfdA-like domain-containing protein n=1 Tax=Gibberella fujikuroi (strain CBS 195.34 / IMI 58289 / NRRL A-6831) TaxID=1279085 RepID=S0EI99_GIBF5|nr:uncharacterized protein FFUJ_10807 [Fusarium fujikuroi IMI 58289]KLO90807.1 uncharacterized protein LW93_103 [Fusarium fujikuroi]QGI70155.1 hypothetical protein CEK27_002484 [Fusarium fujikuroi]QGI87517.1 hypothetical protein CEK25_002473 [Fusarium fujikuroi]QGJ01044.1 hypothetical protein CEK26_002488 [Fusarium fujikuroi]CCT74741.1 uncharacterized protein FFUJ_10807 [Fusarium fujikuroi IMI 58289]
MGDVCESYYPSDEHHRRFWDGQSNKDECGANVPDGFPKALNSTLAWRGEDIQDKETQWKVKLSDQDIASICNAVRAFDENSHDLTQISTTTFPLPIDLSRRLRHLSNNIYNGTGFQILSGLDPSEYSARQNVLLHAGISAHICPERGFVDVFAKRPVGHVVNVLNGSDGPASMAPAFSDGPLSFHTDHCEVLSFYYQEMSPKGGQTILSSSWQAYNELAAHSPEVLHTLAEPWVLDSFKSYSLQPPRKVCFLSNLGPKNMPPVLFRYSRYPILGWQRKRNSELPAPSQKQMRALDAVQFIAQKNAMSLPIARGDMIFINDLAVFHARGKFKDGDASMKRHLLKMYLRDPEQGWTVPQSLQETFGARYTRKPGDLSPEIWDIDHEPGLEELSFVNG